MKVDMTVHPPADLHTLDRVKLTPANQALLAAVLAENAGSLPWKARKAAEALSLVSLSQIAPDRVKLLDISVHGPLRAVVALHVPVALHPMNEELPIAPSALVGIHYEEAAVREAFPGHAFVTVLEPGPATWNPYVAVDGPLMGQLCLGPTLPPGIRVVPILQMTYGALSMASVQLDQFAPGVMNPAAAAWWALNQHRMPLTREPLLSDLPQLEVPPAE